MKTIGALFYDILLVKKQTKYSKIGVSKIMTQKVLPSHPLVAVSDKGASITSDGGNVLLSMFLNSPVVSMLFNNVEFNNNRKTPRYAKVALMLDLRADFLLLCKLIVEEHFLYDSIFTRI